MVETKPAHLRARLRCSGGSALVKINFNDKNHQILKRREYGIVSSLIDKLVEL